MAVNKEQVTQATCCVLAVLFSWRVGGGFGEQWRRREGTRSGDARDKGAGETGPPVPVQPWLPLSDRVASWLPDPVQEGGAPPRAPRDGGRGGGVGDLGGRGSGLPSLTLCGNWGARWGFPDRWPPPGDFCPSSLGVLLPGNQKCPSLLGTTPWGPPSLWLPLPGTGTGPSGVSGDQV